MKKIIITIIVFFSFFSIGYARTGDNRTTPKEIVTSNNPDNLYATSDVLEIKNEDVEYIKELDFQRFEVLQDIVIDKAYITDFSIIRQGLGNKHYSTLIHIQNSVIDAKNLDEQKFNNVSTFQNYYIDSPGNLILAEKKDLANVDRITIDEEYNEEVDKVAKEIYDKSDKTKKGIIKEVTLYILRNMEYDMENYNPSNGIFPELQSSEKNFFETHKGVCEDYAFMESLLLNKLGIFAVKTIGKSKTKTYLEDGTQLLENHAWTTLYLDGVWYSIDPTWLDGNPQIEKALENNDTSNDLLKDYMKKTNDEIFNDRHVYLFSSFDLIPDKESNISILKDLEQASNLKENEQDITVIEGNNQEYIKGQEKNLTFRLDIDFNLFNKKGLVYIDNKLVEKKNYILKEGSTIIEFTKEFTDSLESGKHIIKAVVDNKAAIIEFSIGGGEKNSNTASFIPKTIISIFLLSFFILAYFKRNNYN